MDEEMKEGEPVHKEIEEEIELDEGNRWTRR